MKKLTYLAAAATAAILMNGVAVAGTQLSDSLIDYHEPASLFRAGEFNFDISGVYTTASSGPLDDAWGGSLGITYFVTRYIGIGVEGFLVDGATSFDDRHRSSSDTIGGVNGNLILRLPLDEYRLAPYIVAGGGALIDSDNSEGQVHVGGGLEYRVTDTVGIFGEGRHVWVEDSENYGLFRAGVRFAF